MTPSDTQVRPSGISHSYDQGIAIQCGLVAAILYNHICFWIRHNIIEEVEPINGKTWMWQSIPQMNKYLPELSPQQIKDGLQSLVKNNLISKDCFNKDKFDKKSWYALRDESVLNLTNSKNLFDEAHRPDRQGPQTRCTNIHKDKKILDISDDTQSQKLQKIFTSAGLSKEHLAQNKGQVIMTLEQWARLREEFGDKRLCQVATALSEEIAINPKKYKDHYLTIRKWIRYQDDKKPKDKPDFRAFEGNYTMVREVPTERY